MTTTKLAMISPEHTGYTYERA